MLNLDHWPRSRVFAGLAAVAVLGFGAEQEPGNQDPVFRSDVAMGRVDAQVLDRAYSVIGNLTPDDFILRYRSVPVAIRDFSYQQLPVDVLILLDTSGSMRPNVERVATAAHRALAILGPEDHVGIMTFASGTSVRLEMGPNREEVEKKLNQIVDRPFGGGTDINGAILEAAEYITKKGRKGTRRAIVIVTDDQAKRCNLERLGMALSEADAVLMALLAPQVLESPGGGPAGPGRRSPRSWPGGGGVSWPGTIGLPWPGGGGGPWGIPAPGPVPGGGPRGYPPAPVSAGTEEVAEQSGGDSFAVTRASGLETAFSRIRQQYSMYYYLPEDAQGDDTEVELDLANTTRIHHPDAELRYRQVFLSGKERRVFVKRVPARGADSGPATSASSKDEPDPLRRLPPRDERHGPRVSVAPVGTPPEVSETAPPARRRRGVSERSGTPVVIVPPPAPPRN